MAFKRVCETGPRRENALRGDLKPRGYGATRVGGFQETQTYQALNDSGDSCLRCFARKQAIICIGIAETPV
jgi:hypothetical protein